MGKKPHGANEDAPSPDLTPAERDAFLKSLRGGTSSLEERRHLRGAVVAMLVFFVLFGSEGFLVWQYADWNTASGSSFRGVGMIVAAQLALVGWVYKIFSRS